MVMTCFRVAAVLTRFIGGAGNDAFRAASVTILGAADGGTDGVIASVDFVLGGAFTPPREERISPGRRRQRGQYASFVAGRRFDADAFLL